MKAKLTFNILKKIRNVLVFSGNGANVAKFFDIMHW